MKRTRDYRGESSYEEWLQRTHGLDPSLQPGPAAPAAAAPAPAETLPRLSAEFQTLMEGVMLGTMSATTANKIAVAQHHDSQAMGTAMHPEMAMLASLGTFGTHPWNVMTELEKRLGMQECHIAQPTMVPLPLLDRKARPPKVRWQSWPCFLMQDTLHAFYTHYPEEFHRRFMGSRDDAVLEQYWHAGAIF